VHRARRAAGALLRRLVVPFFARRVDVPRLLLMLRLALSAPPRRAGLAARLRHSACVLCRSCTLMHAAALRSDSADVAAACAWKRERAAKESITLTRPGHASALAVEDPPRPGADEPARRVPYDGDLVEVPLPIAGRRVAGVRRARASRLNTLYPVLLSLRLCS
jgi:hypothetical protein